MATNKRHRKNFRWTLFQDFNDAFAFDYNLKEALATIEEKAKELGGEFYLAPVDLQPDYDMTGKRLDGFRARMIVVGLMAVDDQQTILFHLMKAGWRF